MLIWCCSWLITPTDSPQFRVKPRRLGSGGVVVSHLDSYHKPSFLSLPTVSLHLSETACERELEESGVTERWRWEKAQRGRSRCAQLLGRSEGFWFSQLSCKIRQVPLICFFFVFLPNLLRKWRFSFYTPVPSLHIAASYFQTERNTNSAACNLDPRSGNGWT